MKDDVVWCSRCMHCVLLISYYLTNCTSRKTNWSLYGRVGKRVGESEELRRRNYPELSVWFTRWITRWNRYVRLSMKLTLTVWTVSITVRRKHTVIFCREIPMIFSIWRFADFFRFAISTVPSICTINWKCKLWNDNFILHRTRCISQTIKIFRIFFDVIRLYGLQPPAIKLRSYKKHFILLTTTLYYKW